MNPLLLIVIFLVGFALIDLLAVRHGVDSRTHGGEQKNWW
jgi:hypothetical protein